MVGEHCHALADTNVSHTVAARFHNAPSLVPRCAWFQRIFEPGSALPHGQVRPANSAAFHSNANLVFARLRNARLNNFKAPRLAQHGRTHETTVRLNGTDTLWAGLGAHRRTFAMREDLATRF